MSLSDDIPIGNLPETTDLAVPAVTVLASQWPGDIVQFDGRRWRNTPLPVGSAGEAGVRTFFSVSPPIAAAGTESLIPVNTLSASLSVAGESFVSRTLPVNVEINGSPTSQDTYPVAAWQSDTAIGLTSIPSGSWTHTLFAGASVPRMHRYWRIDFTVSTAGSSGLLGIREIELRGTVGGADQCTSGTATASHQSANAGLAFNNTNSDWWTNGTPGNPPTGGPAAPSWVRYDFGTAVDVQEVSIYPYGQMYAPDSFTVSWSDDGSIFTEVAAFSGHAEDFWADQVAHAFPIDPTPLDAATWLWAVRRVCEVIPEGMTISTAGIGTSRTVTAASGTPFAPGDASADNLVASFLQTPKGIYQITAYTSPTVVTIAVPTGYGNEPAVAWKKWKSLFASSSPGLTTGVYPACTLLRWEDAQPAFTVAATSSLGVMDYASVYGGSGVALTLLYDGVQGQYRGGRISTPMAVGGSAAPVTANRALVSDGTGAIIASTVTSTELGYLSGATSNIQSQINNKPPSVDPGFTGLATFMMTNPVVVSR
ncbi:MAG: hypothetical protein H7838_11415, partial [Magnetococcus sp. DMHC-8]